MLQHKIINIFCKLLWFPIVFSEKIYWFVKRNIQTQDFKNCGKDVFISRHCYFSGNIYFGNDIYVGQGCRFQSTLSKIVIGDHVMFGPDVSIHGGNHRIDVVGKFMKEITLNEKRPEDDLDIFIENDVWIGSGAVILQGITIGEGSIVGANSVITKSIPPYTIIVGSKPQKSWERWDSETIKLHKEKLSKRISF